MDILGSFLWLALAVGLGLYLPCVWRSEAVKNPGPHWYAAVAYSASIAMAGAGAVALAASDPGKSAGLVLVGLAIMLLAVAVFLLFFALAPARAPGTRPPRGGRGRPSE